MKIKISSLLYLVICVLVTSAVSLPFLGIESILPLYELSFGVMVIWYFILLKNLIKKNKGLTIALIVISIFVFIYMVMPKNKGIPIQEMTFLMTLLFMHIGIRHRFGEESIKFFLVTGIIGAIILLYAFLCYADNWGLTSIYTLGGFNPQAIGTWAYIYYVTLIVSLVYFNFPKVIKGVLIIIIAGMVYIMQMTESRGSLVVAILILILSFLPLKSFFKMRLVTITISLIPMLVVIVACLGMNSGLFSNALGGSLLNGREKIWLLYLEESLQKPLLGGFESLEEVYTHNIFLDHVMLLGYSFAIAFIVIMYIFIRQKSIQMQSKDEYCAFVAFMGCVLGASIEGMFFSTGCGGIFVYCYSLLFIINGREANKEHNVKIKNLRKLRIRLIK